MPDNKLTLEAEAQIRRYLWKILGPAGGLAGLFLFGMGWLINDLARGTAYNDALAIFQQNMTGIAAELGKSAADAERAKKNAEDARIEIFRIRDDVKTATITKTSERCCCPPIERSQFRNQGTRRDWIHARFNNAKNGKLDTKTITKNWRSNYPRFLR